MNRKDFIASIPMLGAIPFVGKELIQEKNKIILIEPKPLVRDDCGMAPSNIEFCMMMDGMIVARARNGYTAMHDRDHITSLRLDAYSSLRSEVRVEAVFDYDALMSEFINVQSKAWKK